MAKQLSLLDEDQTRLVDLKEASRWASQYLQRPITPANISYLLQYGHLHKHPTPTGVRVDLEELKRYYDSSSKEKQWKQVLGHDLNWRLSFIEYKESERTKHVHRLHPYKGKFIPQLVEYFLDEHTDEFKQQVFFHPGDIVLDPFCGSGTTLVQANELGLHAIGIDISAFNVMISNVKIRKHDLPGLLVEIKKLNQRLAQFQSTKMHLAFEAHLLEELNRFNSEFFPSPAYKQKVRQGQIKEMEYGEQKAREFLPIYQELIHKYRIQLTQEKQTQGFLDIWYLAPVREEIEFLFNEIRQVEDAEIKKVLAIILSRTARSCRATTHADLATLKEPMIQPYYCRKHGKICKPLFSVTSWWKRYSLDTLNRLREFDKLRTNTYQICLTGDSRTLDIVEGLKKKHPHLAELVARQKIRGIFSSPPYVGLINYHEQHAYAYELFGFERRDELEIGPLYRGQGKDARASYIQGIAEVLRNCKRYLQQDYDVFLVANDKFQLYADIAALAGMYIVQQFKRPVLNRVEKNRSAYAETIFHLKEK